MPLTLQTPPSPVSTAVTLAEAKAHLRVDGADEDAGILSMVRAATEEAEHLMGRAVMPQAWALTLDGFGRDLILLDRPTVVSVTTVDYVDPQGAPGQVVTTGLQLIAYSEYQTLLAPAYGTPWPATRCQPGAVRIVFACGYANAAAVPEAIKTWIKLRVGALYEHRESWTLGKAIERNEFLDYMLDRYRTWSV